MGLKQKRLLRRQKKAEQKRANQIWNDQYAKDYEEYSKLRGEDRQKWLENYRTKQEEKYYTMYPSYKDMTTLFKLSDGESSAYVTYDNIPNPSTLGLEMIQSYYNPSTEIPYTVQYINKNTGESENIPGTLIRTSKPLSTMTTQYWIDKGQNLNDIDQRILDSLDKEELKEKFRQLVNNQKTNNQETNGGL